MANVEIVALVKSISPAAGAGALPVQDQYRMMFAAFGASIIIPVSSYDQARGAAASWRLMLRSRSEMRQQIGYPPDGMVLDAFAVRWSDVQKGCRARTPVRVTLQGRR